MINLNEFKDWLRLNCDSDKTAKDYFCQIKYFLSEYNEITQKTINNKLIYLKDNRSKSTYNLFRCALKKYNEYSKSNFEIPKMRTPDKRINEYITYNEFTDEILPMLSLLFTNYNDKEFILKFMFFTGLRRSELLNLKREDIDLENRNVMVRNTKGKCDRIVPLSRRFSKEVKQFLYNHESHKALNISAGELNRIMRILNDELDFRLKINAKLFRHSCAVYLIQKGMDVTEVSKILGHKKIETTMIYANPNNETVKKKFDKVFR